jgi:hypothetical protein
MTKSLVPRIGRVVAISVVALVMLAALLSAYLRTGFTGEGLLFAVGGLSLLVTSSLLVLRVPENRLSWVLLVVALGTALTGSAGGAARGSILEIVGGIALFGLLLPGLGVFVPLWFPTGRALTPRWNWVTYVTSAGVIGIVGGWALMVFEGEGNTDVENCISVSSCSEIVGLLLVLAGVGAAIASLVVRWIRSRGVERLQMKWLVLAFVVFGIGVFAEFGGYQYSIVANVFLPAGLVLVPVAIGIAVTRYRLYEIDRILSRTVTYAIVIVLLGGVYLGGLAALTTLLSPESPLAVAGSTLAAAAVFNPVRIRVQSWVDRHFNRFRYDAQRVMDRFSDSLRKDLDQDHLMSGWVGVVSETMQPASAGVWVRER